MLQTNKLLFLLLVGLPLLGQAEVPIIDGSADSFPQQPAMTQVPVSPQGQVFMQLQDLERQVQELRGALEEQQNQLQQLQQENRARYQESGNEASAGVSEQSAVQAGLNAAQQPVQPAAQVEPSDPAKEKLSYDAAFGQIQQRDFAKASQAFNGFLRKYPNSSYAGNAQYWLGEINLAQGDLAAAQQAFAVVPKLYPNHSKVPDALYKLADIDIRQGQTAEAKSFLQQLITQFPQSSAAQLAQRDLKNL